MAQRQFHVNHGFGHEKNKYGGGRANLHPKFHHKLEQEIPIKVNGTLLVGVRKDDRKLYLPNEEGNFKCLNGKQEVLFEKVRIGPLTGFLRKIYGSRLMIIHVTVMMEVTSLEHLPVTFISIVNQNIVI